MGNCTISYVFTQQVRALRPNIIPAYGKGNAYTGIGDPYSPFRELLGFLTGDVETRWAAGTISEDLAYRVWKTLPLVTQAITEDGGNLIDVFISGPMLLHRVMEVLSSKNTPEPSWLKRLRLLLERADTQGSAQFPVIQKNLFDQYTRVLVKIADQTPNPDSG